MSRSAYQPKYALLALIILLLMGWTHVESAGSESATGLPGPGDILDPFTLPVPQNSSDSAYLGLEQGSRFQSSELKTDLWLIEVMNVYCASCQLMRPYMNELFSKINADAALKDRVKILAVGAGNQQWDIKAIEDKYDFPVLPDEAYRFHKMVGQPPTPFLIFARPYGQGQLLVVNSHLGRLEDSDALLAMVRQALDSDIPKMGIKPGQGRIFKAQQQQALKIPLTEAQLMARIRESMTLTGRQVGDIEQLPLPGWDRVYSAKFTASGRRVFARVVARKIPCADCHDVFYVYSFDAQGRFLKFVPIAISKYGNEQWSEADIAKIQNRFNDQSLLDTISYRPQVDAVSSATISTELIYDSIADSSLLIDTLIQTGYMQADSGQQ